MRFELIILTVFVLIYGVTGCKSDQYQVVWTFGGHKIALCYDCKCHPTGAKGVGCSYTQCCNDGQCTCHEGHIGARCNKCNPPKTMTNGRCCDPSHSFIKAQGKCVCDCQGSSLCDVAKCKCKDPFTGKGCEERIIKIDSTFIMDNQYRQIIAVECHGDCKTIKGFRFDSPPTDTDVGMDGAWEVKLLSEKTLDYNQWFCATHTGAGVVGGTGKMNCSTARYIPLSKFYIVLNSVDDFKGKNLLVKIPNYKKHSFVAKDKLPKATK